MVAFCERPLCYQVGVVLLVLGTALFAAGVALPWWAQTQGRGSEAVTSHSGLWKGCTSTAGHTTCSSIDAPDWFRAVQVLQCVSLSGMLVSCVYALFTNCCLDHATFSRAIEITAGTGGLLGLVGTLVYMGKTSQFLRQNPNISYSWAFGIDVGACIFVTFLAAIIALSNSRHADQSASRVLLEEGYGSRSGKVKAEMEMTSLRTTRSPLTSARPSEVIVMQNNYGVQSRLAANNGPHVNAASGAPMAGVCGHNTCHHGANMGLACSCEHNTRPYTPCQAHAHVCKGRCNTHPPDCSNVPQKSRCPHMVAVVEPTPLHHYNPACQPLKLPHDTPTPSSASCTCSACQPLKLPHDTPTPSSAPCACSDKNFVHQDVNLHCHLNSVDFVNEVSPGKGEPHFLDSPRIIATAPPLSVESENENQEALVTTKLLSDPETACLGGHHRGCSK